MGGFSVFLTILLVIVELILIAVVLLQSGKSEFISNYAGGAETFWKE